MQSHHFVQLALTGYTEVYLTVPKLRHDVEQFYYLQRRGILGQEFTTIIAAYDDVIDRLTSTGKDWVALDNDAQKNIGHVFNRIVHKRKTPRVRQAFSGTWDPGVVENHYLEFRPGVVVIDDFLSNDALESLRLFCNESTVWSGNRYAHGRLGAFFHDGFNCPLLLQIAEELRNCMPKVIGNRFPLRQLWGYKNEPYLPGGSTTHADFAAVNVNFWITPTECNIDENTGGMIIYDVDAPLTWNFDMYNARQDLIKPYLHHQMANSITIPYRTNRAIIFNSDLFHATAEVRFQQGYENRRINITMLYGEREDDVHHSQLSGRGASAAPITSAAWRSKAFNRTRRRR